jgi:hypothetical protein
MSRDTLTPALSDQILSLIRLGGYPLVAAETAGVPKEIYLDWLKKGDKSNAREPFRTFARDVRKAVAQARVLAEHAIYEKDPKFWLGHGPGKETDECPGWTGERPAARINSVPDSSADWYTLWPELDKVLAAFPEARKAIAAALSGNKKEPG